MSLVKKIIINKIISIGLGTYTSCIFKEVIAVFLPILVQRDAQQYLLSGDKGWGL